MNTAHTAYAQHILVNRHLSRAVPHTLSREIYIQNHWLMRFCTNCNCHSAQNLPEDGTSWQFNSESLVHRCVQVWKKQSFTPSSSVYGHCIFAQVSAQWHSALMWPRSALLLLPIRIPLDKLHHHLSDGGSRKGQILSAISLFLRDIHGQHKPFCTNILHSS